MLKKVLELLVCLLHPVAVILIWIDLATRRNIGGGAKVAWALFALVRSCRSSTCSRVATYGDVGSGDDAPLGGHGTERDAMEALCAADRDIGRQIVSRLCTR